MQKIGRYFIVSLVLVLVSGSAGWFWGRASGRLEIRTEAVKENHGHYKIVDHIGSTVFEWGPAPGVAAPK